MLIDGRGCWLSRHDGFVRAPGQAALFVDRDDLLVRDPGFLHDPGQVELLPGACELIVQANRCNLPVIIATNQSGIARGLYGWPDFAAVSERMLALLRARGGRVSAILACAWHRDGRDGLRLARHDWRKPGPGMFHAARDVLGIDLGRSWMVGDRWSDVRAARNAALEGAVLVKPGGNATQRNLRGRRFRLIRVPVLGTAVTLLERIASSGPLPVRTGLLERCPSTLEPGS